MNEKPLFSGLALRLAMFESCPAHHLLSHTMFDAPGELLQPNRALAETNPPARPDRRITTIERQMSPDRDGGHWRGRKPNAAFPGEHHAD